MALRQARVRHTRAEVFHGAQEDSVRCLNEIRGRRLTDSETLGAVEECLRTVWLSVAAEISARVSLMKSSSCAGGVFCKSLADDEHSEHRETRTDRWRRGGGQGLCRYKHHQHTSTGSSVMMERESIQCLFAFLGKPYSFCLY